MDPKLGHPWGKKSPPLVPHLPIENLQLPQQYGVYDTKGCNMWGIQQGAAALGLGGWLEAG